MMAIDKARVQELIDGLEKLFDDVMGFFPESFKGVAERILMEPLLEMLEEVAKTRPPVFFVIGRSGHGKSAIINALAGRKIAEENDTRPQQRQAEEHWIEFSPQKSTWMVVDTRGYFESKEPIGKPTDQADIIKDPVKALKKDIANYKPDVILHVISANEVRALSKDRDVIDSVCRHVKRTTRQDIPIIAVINKCDGLGDRPFDWPPEDYPDKARQIYDVQKLFAEDIHGAQELTYLDPENKIKGIWLNGESDYVAVVPTSCIDGGPWNIETLMDVITDKLPESALLDFVQAQGRKRDLMKVSRKIRKRCAAIAAGIGGTPIPGPDIVLLLPLQMIMIALIGGLSCRELSRETALEFLMAMGINVGAGIGLREVARQLVKVVPAGFVVAAGVAGVGTNSLGKTAEAYFFRGKIERPKMGLDESAAGGDE